MIMIVIISTGIQAGKETIFETIICCRSTLYEDLFLHIEQNIVFAVNWEGSLVWSWCRTSTLDFELSGVSSVR